MTGRLAVLLAVGFAFAPLAGEAQRFTITRGSHSLRHHDAPTPHVPPTPRRAARRSTRPRSSRKAFARALRAAKLPGFRLYDLRHTFASLLLAQNAPITYVSAQLGHTDATTTLRWYARWLPRTDKRAVDMLDDGRDNAVERLGEARVGTVGSQFGI